VNVIGMKILIYATADQRNIFTLQLEIKRYEEKYRNVKEGSCQLKSRILGMSLQLSTEPWRCSPVVATC